MKKVSKQPAQPCANEFARRSIGWRKLTLVLLLLPVFLATQPLRSQQGLGTQAPQGPPITVHVKVVNLLATVHDKKGAIVRNLGQDDFELKEDDRPQSIRYFSHETDLPLTLGLLVDTGFSQHRVLGDERDAASAFLDQVLRVDKDKAFVIHFDREVELLQDLTASREKLQKALSLLQVPQRSEEGHGDSPDSGQDQHQGPGGQRQGGHGRGGWGGGGTTLFDAIYLASNDIMAKQGGRKALIVLSDGVDRNSKKTLASAIEAAQRSDTLVYSILFAPEPEFGGGGGGYGHHGMGGGMGGGGHHGGGYPHQQESRPDGKKILERLSKETGGRFFEVSKKHPVDETFSQIQEELRSQYSLGYTPEPPNSGAGYHKITLTTKKKDLVVQARDGYYSESSH
ncbi:MAG: VWA domain-containing protein [Acidobacteriota bacterium]|nr:VWA domain-containing protein [Acidobacteriota bacterium]